MTRPHYDVKADVFSFGISFFEVLTCKKPYSDNEDITRNPYVFMNAMKEQGIRPGPLTSQPEDVKNIITSCWEEDPELRPSMERVYNDLDSIIKNR